MAGHEQYEMIRLPDGVQRVECPEPVEGLAFVYMLYVRNGTFYVGHSQDVQRRLDRHSAGTGARHTNQMKQFDLVYAEGPMELEVAIKRERQLKKWSKAKKIALISGEVDLLQQLSKSRD